MGVRGKRKKPTRRTVRAEVRWRGIVADHRTSGKGVEEFCRERGINKIMLYKWRKRFRVADAVRTESSTSEATKPAAAASPAARLVPVRVTASRDAVSQSWGMEMTFPSGHVLRVGHGVSAEVITAVLATMRAVAC
jgi:transposase-like protein